MDNSTSISISSSSGNVISINSRMINGSTELESCWQKNPIKVKQDNLTHSVEVQRIFDCGSGHGALVNDLFTRNISSITWSTTLKATGKNIFSVPIITKVDWGTNTKNDLKYWAPLTKGCVQNTSPGGGGMCYGKGAWSNPLVYEQFPNGAIDQTMKSLSSLVYRLGQGGAGIEDSISIPMVIVTSGTNSTSFGGVTLLLSPEDPLLNVLLTVGPSSHSFSRQYHRFNSSSTTIPVFSLHIKAHTAPAGFRNALAFAKQTFPRFFLPNNPKVAIFEGLASYSWNLQEYDQARATRLGFMTNWDLSGTFMPYDGLFLPYADKWLNLGPINGGLSQYNVTFKMINQYYERIQQAGFHSLSYFDIGNWGTRIKLPPTGPIIECGKRPNGEPAPCWVPETTSSSRFLWDHLKPALLKNGWSLNRGFIHNYLHDWVGTTDMDSADKYFEDMLIEQAQLHNEKLPFFEGIAIDRLDYSEIFNYDADDGVSWVPYPNTSIGDINKNTSMRRSSVNSLNDKEGPWGAARSFRLSYRHTFQRLSDEVIHKGNSKVMFMNCNTLCRIDLLPSFDGTFSEGAALNSVAWTGIAQPTILWTYGLEGRTSVELDKYFQQHLLMNVFPMAPMPKNDHCIQPGNETIENWYANYAPLFVAMRGARWWLEGVAEPVRVLSVTIRNKTAVSTYKNIDPIVNAFSIPAPVVRVDPIASLLVPIMLAPPNSVVTLQLIEPVGMHDPDKDIFFLEVLHPGRTNTSNGNINSNTESNWEPISTVTLKCGIANVTLKLRDRGAAMLRATRLDFVPPPDHTKLILQPCTSLPTQQFTWNNDSTVHLTAASNMCIDLYMCDAKKGIIDIWHCHKPGDPGCPGSEKEYPRNQLWSANTNGTISSLGSPGYCLTSWETFSIKTMICASSFEPTQQWILQTDGSIQQRQESNKNLCATTSTISFRNRE